MDIEKTAPMNVQRICVLLTPEEYQYLVPENGITFICAWDQKEGHLSLRAANKITMKTWKRDSYFNGEPKRQSYMERFFEALEEEMDGFGDKTAKPFLLKAHNIITYDEGETSLKQPYEAKDSLLRQALVEITEIFPHNQIVYDACKHLFEKYRYNGLLYLDEIVNFQLFTDWKEDLTKIVNGFNGNETYEELVKKIDSMIRFTTCSELLFDECYANYFKDFPEFYHKSEDLYYKFCTSPLVAHFYLGQNGNREKLDFSFPNKNELIFLFACIEKGLMDFFKIPNNDNITMRTALYSIPEKLQVSEVKKEEEYSFVILDDMKIEIADFKNAIRMAVDSCVDKICEMRMSTKTDRMVI